MGSDQQAITGRSVIQFKQDISKYRLSFSNYNMVRMREALRYFSEKTLQLFLKIPFYLHINIPNYPGYISTRSKPHGIWNFENTGFYKEAVARQYFPKSVIANTKTDNPAILGLYHIGSLGTFTQSTGSDFDYWVLIDNRKFSHERFESLKKKLDDIKAYSLSKYDQKVSFFIMNKKDIRENKYTSFIKEENLAAPRIFLKEEFYRTFLMIAGKIPLWAVLPSELSMDASLRAQAQIRQILANNDDLIDLGQIYQIPSPDILKGLFWHICKSKADPVKAIIKATMIYSYGFGDLKKRSLLCEQVKQNYAKAGIDDYTVDPYKALFDEIIRYHEDHDPKGLNLIKNAVFYRLCGYPEVELPAENSPKRNLLEKYIRIWNLKKNQISKLLSFRTWSESEKLILERSFIERLANMAHVAKKKIGAVDRLIDSKEKKNWVILTNKTKERLNPDPARITECSLYLRRQNLIYLVISQKKNRFQLTGRCKATKEKEVLGNSDSLFNILGWVLENQLYRRQTCEFEFLGEKKIFEATNRPVGPDDIYLKFIPLKPLSDEPFARKAQFNKLVVLLEYDKQHLSGAHYLISNSWGELFFYYQELAPIQTRERKVDVVGNYIAEYTRNNPLISFFQYAENHDTTIVYQIKKAYNKTQTEQSEKTGKKTISKPFLDKL